jgi:hypothetical protein
MEGEYKIFTIKDGRMVEVKPYDFERKVRQEQLASLYHDLSVFRERLNEIMAANFIEERVSVTGGKSLSDIYRDEILRRGSFTAKEMREIVTGLVKAQKLEYAQNSIDSTFYSVVKELMAAEKVNKPENSDRYINLVFEEKEEAEVNDKDGTSMDESSMSPDPG